MVWNWVWIGGALVLGFYLGMTLMSLLNIAHQQTNESRSGDMRIGARRARAACSASRSPRSVARPEAVRWKSIVRDTAEE